MSSAHPGGVPDVVPRTGASRSAGRGGVHLRRRRRPARYDGSARAGAERDHAGPPAYDDGVTAGDPGPAVPPPDRGRPGPRGPGPPRPRRRARRGRHARRVRRRGARAARLPPLRRRRPRLVGRQRPDPRARRPADPRRHRPRAGRQPRVDVAGPARPSASPVAPRPRPRHRLRRPGAAPLRPRRRGRRHRREPARPRRHRLQRSAQRRARRRPRRLAVGAGRRRAVRPGHHQPAVRDLARDRRARSSTATPACPATRSSRRSCAGRRPTSPTVAGARSWPTGRSRADRPWDDRLAEWLDPGCDALVVQREVLDPASYVELWLRDAGRHSTPGYLEAYDAWLGWFEREGIEGIGFGWINLRRGGSARELLDWPHAVEQPIATAIRDWGHAVRVEVGLDDRLVTRADVQQETVGAPGGRGPRVDRAAPADRPAPRPPRRHGRGRAGRCLRRRADGRADPRRRRPPPRARPRGAPHGVPPGRARARHRGLPRPPPG